VGLCNGAVCIAKNVWAVGFFTPSGGTQQGVASEWDGSTWSTATRVADAYILYSINGLGANDIWAAGTAYPNGMTQPSQGLAAHFTGVWTPNHLAYNTAVNSSLTGIWDISGSNVWAVGNDTGSFVAQFGTGWQLGRLGMDSAAATWASAANDVWAVGIASGSQGKVAHWTSNANIGSPSITTIPSAYLTSIWGSGAGDVWVGGQNGSGAALFYWPSGYGGTPVTYPISAVGVIMGIWGSGPLDVWAVGSNASQQGVVLHWTNGPSSTPAATIINNATYLSAIWGSGRNDVWAVGQNQSGAIAAHFTGSWSTAIAIPGMRGALGVWGVAR
jgi:hypothetical protein